MIQKYNDEAVLVTEGSTPYLRPTAFEKYKEVKVGFFTRLGGVSKGHLRSLNLGFNLGDDRENVLENYKRVSDALGIEMGDIVLTRQVHENTVRNVKYADRGNGIFSENRFESADGLVTNEKNVCLSVFGADCVPLVLYDPVENVISSAHAGWRGTVSDIAGNAVRKMNSDYGSRPENIVCVLGPSICGNCYEISEDVAVEFAENYDGLSERNDGIVLRSFETVDDGNKKRKTYADNILPEILYKNEEDKIHADLWNANRFNLLRAGVKDENIHLMGLCTKCRNDLFHSHRATCGKRGVQGGFVCLT